MITRLCVAVVLLMPALALAQGNPGPYGGLFGRSPARAGRDRTVMEVRSSIGGQYDSAIFAPEGTPEEETQGGIGSGASAGLVFQHQTDKFTALVDGGVSRSQYFVAPAYGVNTYSGNASITSTLTSRLGADLSVSYTHSPFYEIYPSFGRNTVAVDPSAGAVVPFSPYATQMLENETLYASAGIGVRLTEKTKLSASAYHRQTMFATSDADFEMNGYRAAWTWEVRRDLSVHAGYGLEHSDQSGDLSQDFDNETIDVGVDYSRSFSIARRTTLGFSSSTSLVKTGTSARELRVNGGLVLSKFFRRTWRAAAYVNRSTGFVPGFYEPLYSDTVGVSLSGMFSTRTEWFVSADAGRAEAAFSNTTGFDSVGASSRISFAINKYLGLYGRYTLYRYELPANSNALDLAEHMARQTVTVGLSAYIPVFQKMGQ